MDTNNTVKLRDESLTSVVGGVAEKINRVSVEKSVLNILGEQTGNREIYLGSHLGDLGMDSLDVVDVVQVIENRFGVKFPYDVMVRFTCVEDVVDYVYNQLAGRDIIR